MNWEMISAIGEIVGAVAVVASLVYLARQVRFSNRLAQAEAFRTPISDINNLNATFGLDPTFRDAIFRVIEGATPDDLTPDQAQVAEIFLIAVLNSYEQLFREVRAGVLNEEALSDFAGSFLLELPFLRARWPSMRLRLGTSFVRFVESQFEMTLPPVQGEGGG